MGHPQLGFPRLRLVAGMATGIAIGPDHTPSWVTVLQNPRTGGAWFAGAGGVVIFSGGMAVSVEMQHTGCVPAVRAEIGAIIEHAFADRPGDWRVSIIGSQANDLAFFDFFLSDLCVWQGSSESATLFLDVPVRVSAAWMHL